MDHEVDIVTTSNFNATLLSGPLYVAKLPSLYVHRCASTLLRVLFMEEELPQEVYCPSPTDQTDSVTFSLVSEDEGISLILGARALEFFKEADHDKYLLLSKEEWRAIEIRLGHGSDEFPGLIRFISQKMAERHISILNISTYSVDIMLVRQNDVDRALDCLKEKGEVGVRGLLEEAHLRDSLSGSSPTDLLQDSSQESFANESSTVVSMPGSANEQNRQNGGKTDTPSGHGGDEDRKAERERDKSMEKSSERRRGERESSEDKEHSEPPSNAEGRPENGSHAKPGCVHSQISSNDGVGTAADEVAGHEQSDSKLRSDACSYTETSKDSDETPPEGLRNIEASQREQPNTESDDEIASQFLTEIPSVLRLAMLRKEYLRENAYILIKLLLFTHSTYSDLSRKGKESRESKFEIPSPTSKLWALTSTAEETSLILEEDMINQFTEHSLTHCPDRWRGVKLCEKYYGWDEAGLIAAMSNFRPDIPVLNVRNALACYIGFWISTYSTSITFVDEYHLDEAMQSLSISTGAKVHHGPS